MGISIKLSEVIPHPHRLMGVKAVWRKLNAPVICFAPSNKSKKENDGYYSTARIPAKKASEQPYILTIGAGRREAQELSGRVLELVRATRVYGETSTFVLDEEVKTGLHRWPVSLVVSEVYAITGDPHLVDDLGFPDRKILEYIFDRVDRKEDYINRLWAALKDRSIERRRELLPPPGFHDPGEPMLCRSPDYPQLDIETCEGERIWKHSLAIEQNSALARQVKDLNRKANGGVLKCETCDFSDDSDAMFDAHHFLPLHACVRISRVDDLAVLCPSCHRWAHVKAENDLHPVPLDKLARGIAASRANTSGLGLEPMGPFSCSDRGDSVWL